MCGIAGAYYFENAQDIVAQILFALQHRGQESCGLSTRVKDGNVLTYKNMGLVKNVLNPEALQGFAGLVSIGHVRYPTKGKSNILNTQPHSIELAQGAQFSVCSNGDIVNYRSLRKWLEEEHGFIFKSDNDGELIGRLIAFYHVVQKVPIEEAIFRAQQELKGAFSTLLIFRDTLYAIRDPHGFRPFEIGHMAWDGKSEVLADGTVFSSESCAFPMIGAKKVRSVEPGEIVKLVHGKPIESVKKCQKEKRHCVFELIYFSRPDSLVYEEHVYKMRKKIGARLASYDKVIKNDNDLVVISVPDSSNFVALGYAEEKKAKFDMALLRNHYVGRTFTKPEQKLRDEGVLQKYSPLPDYFSGKRVVMVDDSIVRGTTLRNLVKTIKEAGAKEVHVRIGSPKVIGPCYYGIDTPTQDELIANKMKVEEITSFLGADSLRYCTVEDLHEILYKPNDFCYACFNRDYIYPPEKIGSNKK